MGRAMRTEVSAGLNGEFALSNREAVMPPADLAVAVARLLAIAVGEIQRHHALAITEAERVPDYRFWPMIETLQRSGDRTVRFYVCPKGVLASDEEFFPVGTQFVMETSGDRRIEVFIMKKYAALYLSERAVQDREVWMSARCLVACEDVTCARTMSANR
jgi:hypothetical protein